MTRILTAAILFAMTASASAQNQTGPARGPQPEIYAEQSHRIAAEIERAREARQSCGRMNAPCKDSAR